MRSLEEQQEDIMLARLESAGLDTSHPYNPRLPDSDALFVRDKGSEIIKVSVCLRIFDAENWQTFRNLLKALDPDLESDADRMDRPRSERL